MGQPNDAESNERTGEVSRRALLGSIGAGALAGGLPLASGTGRAGAGESSLTGTEIARNQLERSRRSRLYPVAGDLPESSGAPATTGDGPEASVQRLLEKPGCFEPGSRPIYGPTDVNAQSANGRLAVATNRRGTMTVFKWPRPSFYDQLKYFTEGRDENNEIVTAPNQGSFLGLAVDTGDGFETTWLREWSSRTQGYRNDDPDVDRPYSDEIVTRYVDEELGLKIRVNDVVTQAVDAFVRRVRVTRREDSPVEAAKLLAFENLNLVVGKVPQFPLQDWCLEEDNASRARYLERLDAIVHDRIGVDPSTGEQQSVAIAVGFDGESTAHQVGGDAYDPLAAPAGRGGPTTDAYDDAATGSLSGNDSYVGQATGALSTALEFDGGHAEETVVFAAGEDETEAAATLGAARSNPFERLRERKEAWLDELLAEAPLPDRDAVARRESAETTRDIMATARRALVTLVTTFDQRSGAVVASITTQPPYGEDWPRDGAFFNYVLDLIGRHEWVETRNQWYASIQQQTADALSEGDLLEILTSRQYASLTTLQANWNMCYYADGVAGGPIPYQIDTTGFVVWTLYDHYKVTGDESYLRSVYPAIRRAAEYLVACRDPSNGLQCRNFEDDRFSEPFRQTINGAVPAWRALKAATQAARTLGREADAARYEERMHELGRAIDEQLYNESEGCYGCGDTYSSPYGETTWPLGFTPYADPETGEIADRPQVEDPYEHPRIQRHLSRDAEGLAAVLAEPEAGETDNGGYNAKTILPLAKARRQSGPGDIETVRDAVRWVGTQHATDDTHVMGEFWRIFGEGDDRKVRSIQGQPHIWEQVFFYLMALEAYPPAGTEFEPGTYESVTGALRE